MATVTGLTAARMEAIENASVVSGIINGAGHLILTTYGGSEIDAGPVLGSVPNASDTVAGLVELATSSETTALSDSTRAVTPAGLNPVVTNINSALDSLDSRVDTLEALPGSKVQIITAPAQTALPSSYPTGLSLCTVGTGSGWTPNGGFGSVWTSNIAADRCVQKFFSNRGGTGIVLAWTRTYHSTLDGGGWTSWIQDGSQNILSPSSINQSSSFTNYPYGISYLYLTSSQSVSGSWSWGSKYALVTTYRYNDDIAVQTYQKHQGGTGSETSIWQRTANSTSGWSGWNIIRRDAKLPDPAIASYSDAITISATAFADLPNPVSITMSFAYDCIVQIQYDAWVGSGSTSGSQTRTGIALDGVDPPGSLGATWGDVLWSSAIGTSAMYQQRSMSASLKVLAGSHTFTARAYRITSNGQVNYPNLRVTPIRWAE